MARIVTDTCPCGRTLKRIATIEGRIADMVVLPDGRKITGTVMASRLNTNADEITERQVIQKDLVTFHVRYVRGKNFNMASLEKLRDHLNRLLSGKVVVTFEEVNTIPRERSGKIRFVISEIGG